MMVDFNFRIKSIYYRKNIFHIFWYSPIYKFSSISLNSLNDSVSRKIRLPLMTLWKSSRNISRFDRYLFLIIVTRKISENTHFTIFFIHNNISNSQKDQKIQGKMNFIDN